MQISIQPKVKKILITLGEVVLLVIAFFAFLPLFHKTSSEIPSGVSPDAQAAVDAVTAFYTLDYTETPDLWATRVCTLTTEAGCRAIRGFYGPAVEKMVQENQIQTGCNVIPLHLISEQGNIRMWQVSVSLDHPWSGLDQPVQDAFAEVENVNGLWLMNRILFQQEVTNPIPPTP
jgi:hypothetical protein